MLDNDGGLMAGFNHFNQIADALPKVLHQVVVKTAMDIQAKAASRAPVDTGFLRNSIYTVTSEGSNYREKVGQRRSKAKGIRKASAKRVREARRAQKQVEESLLPPIGEMPDETTAYVAVGASYAVYVEFGTKHMPARPYFIPAVEATRLSFERALSAIERKLAE